MKHSLGPSTLVYPMPAFLVGSYGADGKANIMTAAWGGICNSDPPCVMVAIRPSRLTHQSVLARAAFTISIPSCGQARETDFAGIMPGKNVDKFAAARFTATRSGLVDAPYVEECPVVLECSLFRTVELGSHTQFIGKILDVKISPECLTDGKPDITKIDPLVYNGGQALYHGVGREAGRAFSMGKQIKS